MARARNIKPNFFKNYDLADQGMAAQLLFAGLWCLADKEGRLEDKPRLIKAEIFPYYEVDVNGELTKLERLGFVDRYEVNGFQIIEICNFKKHQSPHHTEKNSELPCKPINYIKNKELENNGESTVDSPKQDGGNPSDSLIPDSLNTDSLIPDSDEPKGSSSRPKIMNAKLKLLLEKNIPENLALDWLLVRKEKKQPLTETALKATIREAEKVGYTLEQAITVCCENSWAGFKAEYIQNKTRNTRTPVATEDSRKQTTQLAKERLFGKQTEVEVHDAAA